MILISLLFVSRLLALATSWPIYSHLQAPLRGPRSPFMATAAAAVAEGDSEQKVNGEKVPGNNNATFCTVPKLEQLFSVEFLDVAPLPVPVNQIFFVYLRGNIAEMPNLAQASLRIIIEAEFASGKHEGPRTYSAPLQTTSFGDHAHLAIRNATGGYGGSLCPGRNDILTDCWIPNVFLQKGWYTFQVEGVLPDGQFLFCFKTRQWLG